MIQLFGLRRSGTLFARSFASVSQILPETAKLSNKFTQRSLDLYKQNKTDVDKELDKVCDFIFDVFYMR